MFAWLACDVALWAVALGKDCEQNVILSCHAKIGGKIGARLADEGSLNEVVVLAGWALDALDGDLCVGVVVPIIVTYANLKLRKQSLDIGHIQWGSEIQTCPDFDLSKKVRVFKWSRYWMGSDIWKPDHLKFIPMVIILSKTIWHPSKSVQIWNCRVFKSRLYLWL